MDVEEKLRQAKSQFPKHTVDKKVFSNSFWTKVDQLESEPTRSVRRKRMFISGAAAVVMSGIIFSPGIASAVQRVPLVHVVLNWVKGTDAAPYVRNVQESVTDRGITMTITDVLYGPSELSFGYIVTPGQPGFPHGGAVGLGGSGMQFYVNGQKAHLQAMSSDDAASYGFKGMVTLTDAGTGNKLPSSFHLQIVIHKIGDTRGTWKFNVPVSQQDMKPVKTFIPMVNKRLGEDTLTIEEVQIYPTGGKLTYQITEPAGQHEPVHLMLFDQNKQLVDLVDGEPAQAQFRTVSGGLATWSFSQDFRIPSSTPTALTIVPSVGSIRYRTVPLSGPFPVTIDNGMLGVTTINSASINGKTITVHYTMNHGTQVAPLLHFSIDDTSDPNARGGGNIGELVSQSATVDQFVDTFTYEKDISSDRLVLDLPDSNTDVFEVPLKNNP